MFATCACSGASGSYSGAGMFLMIASNSGSRLSLTGSSPFAGWSVEA